jgi:hypothetical protein
VSLVHARSRARAGVRPRIVQVASRRIGAY